MPYPPTTESGPYQLLRLALERDGAEHDLLVYAVPPVPRRHPLHEDVVRQRGEEGDSREHLAQQSDRRERCNLPSFVTTHNLN